MRLAELKRLLDAFKWARSPDQFRFHQDFIQLCLAQIYGSDFEANRQRLMDMFGIDSFKVGALVLTPRRWGKTTSVAMFIAAMLIVCEGNNVALGVTIATFSSVLRQSSAFRAKVPTCRYRLVIRFAVTKVAKYIHELGYGNRIVRTSKVVLRSKLGCGVTFDCRNCLPWLFHPWCSAMENWPTASRGFSRPTRSIGCLPIQHPQQVRFSFP